MRRCPATLLPALAILACVGGAIALFGHGGDRPVRVDAAGEPMALASPPNAEGVRGAQRREVRPATTVTAPPSFDEVVDELVALGERVASSLGRGEPDDAALDANRSAERRLDELHLRWSDAAERALARLTTVPDRADGAIRRAVLQRIVGDGLDRQLERARRGGSRQTLDALVAAMLQTIPATAALADGLGRMLVDAPFLCEAHETAVLGIADQSRDVEFLEPIAAGLLRTLWNNLRQNGSRTDTEIAAFALLLQDDLNDARRRAALAELLRAENGRHRQLAVERVVASGDVGLARELAEIAARELPVDDALELLGDLHDVAGNRLLGAYLAVGERDGQALLRSYGQHLADGTRPELRAELVSGTLATAGPGGLRMASLAFENDPDPGVRRRALYALAAHPDPTVAEQTLQTALDDPRHSADPAWVADVAGALRNLAGRPGSRQALRRVGLRLVQHPLLGEAARATVESLLDRNVPVGDG